jgi:hypothetical protein
MADVVSCGATVSGVTALEAGTVSAPAVIDVFSIEVAADVVAFAVVLLFSAVVVLFVSAVAIVSVMTDVAEVSVPFPQPVEHTSTANKIIAIKNLNLLLYIPI